LDIQAEHRTLHLNWQELNEPGIIGYRIYYDTDTAGPPYNGTSSEETQNSPVTVGNIGSYTLTGLDNSQAYHIVITALDAYGNESHYSNEMLGQPVLKAITNLAIANEDTGIRLSWTPASGATSYKVYRSPQPLQDISQMQYLGETTDPWWIDQTAGSDIQNFYLIISIGY
jgi:fibronectin type 3 domain-containing protein